MYKLRARLANGKIGPVEIIRFNDDHTVFYAEPGNGTPERVVTVDALILINGKIAVDLARRHNNATRFWYGLDVMPR